MTLATLGLVALVAGIAGLLLVDRFVARSVPAAAAVLLLVVVEATLGEPLQVALGALTVYATDVLAAALLAAALARLLRAGRVTPLQACLLVFTALALLSLVRGVAAFGVQPAANEFRKFFGWTAAALYFSTVPPPGTNVRERVVGFWFLAAGALGVLALFRWGALAAGLAGGVFGPGGTVRVLDAAGALFLAQAFFLALPRWREHDAVVLRWVAPAFLALVVLLQHRTVWAVGLVGIALLAWQDPVLRRGLALLVLAAAMAGAVLSFLFFDSGEGVTEQLSGAATNADTFAWRYEGWRALLADGSNQGLVETLVGEPFGTGWTRRVEGQTVDVSPHNFYLETYLRLGLVGLGALLTLAVLVWQGLRRHAEAGAASRAAPGTPQGDARALLVLLAALLTYSLTYTPSLPDGLLLGLMAALAGTAAATATEGPAPLGPGRVIQVRRSLR